MTSLYEQYAHKRAEVQNELNAQVIKHISFEVYKKTEQERVELANAKIRFKQTKNK
jgi:hypothetical protein